MKIDRITPVMTATNMPINKLSRSLIVNSGSKNACAFSPTTNVIAITMPITISSTGVILSPFTFDIICRKPPICSPNTFKIYRFNLVYYTKDSFPSCCPAFLSDSIFNSPLFG